MPEPTDRYGLTDEQLHALGHNPQEVEQPLRQRPVSEDTEPQGTHVETTDPETGAVTIVETSHKPGTPRPRKEDVATPADADVPAAKLDYGVESPDGSEQYRRPNIVRPPYGGA